MGTIITLRDNPGSISYFKEEMLKLIYEGKGDEILLASGFFGESTKGQYKASIDKSDRMGIDIITAIKAARNYEHVRIVGAYDNHNPGLDAFVNALRNNLGNILVSGYERNGGKWHAKVFLIVRHDLQGTTTPIAGIVGSSNMTSYAYGSLNSVKAQGITPNMNHFNIETDTIILSEKIYKQEQVEEMAAYLLQTDGHVIVTGPNTATGKLESQALLDIYQKINDRIKDNPTDRPNLNNHNYEFTKF